MVGLRIIKSKHGWDVAMFTTVEITKFNQLISFCSTASDEIKQQISSSSSNGWQALRLVKTAEQFIANRKNSQLSAANLEYLEGLQETAGIKTIQETADENKKTAQDQALKVARLKILEHSIRLITQQLQELGSPYKVENRNRDEYRPLSFWEKTYTQHATFYTHKQNLQSIQMVNNLYNREEYEFSAILNFVVEFKEQANLDQIIKPVNNIYYFMFYAFLGLLAALYAAIALVAIYATPVVGPVVGTVLMTVLTLLALTSMSGAEVYYDQHALFSSKYKPLSKTHSFIDVSAAVKNDDFNDLVTNNICQILGQVAAEEVHDSNKVQVNALAGIGLEQIKNDYLSTLSQA